MPPLSQVDETTFYIVTYAILSIGLLCFYRYRKLAKRVEHLEDVVQSNNEVLEATARYLEKKNSTQRNI